MTDYKDRDWLYTQRFVKRLSLRKIAVLCNVSHECIRKRLLKYGFLEESDELLKKEIEEFDRLVKENKDFILTVLCKGEDKEFWERVLSSVMEKEAEPKKKQPVGRVARNRQTHPGDRIEHGGGSISTRHYDPKSSGRSFREEMNEIQSVCDRLVD